MKEQVAVVRAVVFIVLASFALSSANAQTFTDLANLNGAGSLGLPISTLAQGRDAELYGLCYGTSLTGGSVFKLTTSGGTDVLYTFTTGAAPLAGVTLATDGNYYGTTGGGGTYADGVLFRISADGVYSVLHNFSGADGANPAASPIQATDGNLYGTTSGTAGAFLPTIYKYSLSGKFTTIATLNSADGEIVEGLIQGSDGNLYGLAQAGGAYKNGTIFKVSTAGVLLSVYSFPGGKLGAVPVGSLIQASDGYFYGAAYTGGSGVFGNGTVFRMSPAGKVSTLYTFHGASDGQNPFAGLVQATDGKLYGTTSFGGAYTDGTIFQITTAGAFKELYSFTGTSGNSGEGLMQHTNGLFYGATEGGGTYGDGVVYSLDMGLGPFVTFVQPFGKVGHAAEILGQGLTGTTSVTFNGIPATSFTVESDTYMTAVVPGGATGGTVTVTTPTGTLTSNTRFTILK
jgi:uncharacterized repeat protein (TIGR03803 family)